MLFATMCSDEVLLPLGSFFLKALKNRIPCIVSE